MTDLPACITLDGPNETDPFWWYYCECTHHDGGAGFEVVRAAAIKHGNSCKKGQQRAADLYPGY